MRFKSNRGGYLGKAVRVGGALFSGTGDDFDYFKSAKGSELRSRLMAIKWWHFEAKEKEDVIEILDDVSRYISDDQIMELSGIAKPHEIDGDWASIQNTAQLVFIAACERLKELSAEEHQTYLKYYDEKVSEPEREKKRNFKRAIIALVILLVLASFIE